MTSAPIFDTGVKMPGIQPLGNQKGTTKESSDFAQAIGQATISVKNENMPELGKGNEESVKAIAKGKEDDSKEISVKKELSEPTKESASETVTKTEEDTETDFINEDEELKAVREVEETILNDLATVLMISPEELQSVLKDLDLSVGDLLQPENVNLLVSNVLGDGNPMSLITNEDLSQAVFAINHCIEEIIQDFSEQFPMEQDEMMELLNQSSNQEFGQTEIDVLGEVEVTQISNKENVQVNASTENETADQIATENTDNVEDAIVETEKQTSTNKDAQEQGEQGREEHQTNREMIFHDAMDSLYQGNVIRSDTMRTEAPQNILEQSVNAQEVVDQITEYIRTEAKGTISSIQLQLHPESLGNIGLTVASKEGAVTAQFTAQNEAVKAALESQIVVLKENLEQQGVKVEAVEVTVASHEFEQNLEKGNQENSQQEDEQEKLRKATRKLDLGQFGITSDLDDIEDEDVVTVKMMQADGNSLDYKV